MTIKQVSSFTGCGKTSVERWCNKRFLKNFYIKRRYYIPKEYLFDFLLSGYFISSSIKSEGHKALHKKIR